tara:strand:+ start:20439 stop:21011 length:573 start_codon:yes stop_codon:yes gene_type:complete
MATIEDGRYIEAPQTLPIRALIADHIRTVFLAGGISGTEDWQIHAAQRFIDESRLTVINPRRPGGLSKTGDEAARQIQWEFESLRHSQFVLFWFPPETVCPIALFELGTFLGRGRNYRFEGKRPIDGGEGYNGTPWPYIYVGCHPDYSRRFDLEQQIPLYDERVTLRYDLDEVIDAIIEDSKILAERRDS